MWKALRRSGESAGRGQVQRLMRQAGIQGANRRGKPWRTTRPDPLAKRRPDLVERNFTADGPDRLWVADLTCLRCWEGLVFFAFVVDAWSRKVVGWQLAQNMRTTLVLAALRMALGQRRPGADVALVHHSDRGSQYTSIDSSQTLSDHSVLQSVGSVGDAYDNALAESFVDSFKVELIKDRVWQKRSQLELAIVEYVGWFNNARLHESLGDIPPAEFELLHANGPLRSPSGLAALPVGAQIDNVLIDQQTPTFMTARPDHLKLDSTSFGLRGTRSGSPECICCAVRAPAAAAPKRCA
jgi:putative transposase